MRPNPLQLTGQPRHLASQRIVFRQQRVHIAGDARVRTDHGPTSDVDQTHSEGKQQAVRRSWNPKPEHVKPAGANTKKRPEQGRIERLKAIPITRPERTTSCDVAQIVPLVFQMWCGSILKSCGGPKPEARTVRPDTTGSARRALIGAPHHPTCPKAGFFWETTTSSACDRAKPRRYQGNNWPLACQKPPVVRG